jgi:DNA-binding transcriptional MerR regulator
MGSGKVDQTWVANRLGKSSRTIRNWADKGLLKQTMENGRPMYDLDEVEQIARDQGTDYPALTRKNFILLQQRLQKLEQDMTVLRMSNGMVRQPLHPSALMAKSIYSAAVSHLATKTYGIEEIEEWLKVFDNLDEASLTIFEEASNVDRPWQVFFRLLCEHQIYIARHPAFETTLKLQEIHDRLTLARNHFRKIILVWMETHREGASGAVLKELESPEFGILQAVRAKAKRSLG